jgi:hypothetical protein
MVELQFELCSSRWLLFLTADVRVENISTGTMNSLAKAIKENAQHNEEFKNDAIELLSAPDKSETVADAIDLASQKTGESFIKLFALGFSKWVLHLAKSKNWQLKMHRSYYYSTTSQSNIKPSMPCMAFEFLPPIPALEDRFDAVNAAPRTQGDGEDLSMRALKKVAEMEDLDKLMSSDMSLRDDMIAATKALLEDAGYAASTLAKLDSAWE